MKNAQKWREIPKWKQSFSLEKCCFQSGVSLHFQLLSYVTTSAAPKLTNFTVDLFLQKSEPFSKIWSSNFTKNEFLCLFILHGNTVHYQTYFNLHECTKVCPLHLYPVIMKCIIIYNFKILSFYESKLVLSLFDT